MWIWYDEEADTITMQSRQLRPGEGWESHRVESDLFAGALVLDMDEEGKLVHIEAWPATRVIPAEIIARAKRL